MKNEPRYLEKLKVDQYPVIMPRVDSFSEYEQEAQNAIETGDISSLFKVINEVLPNYVSCGQLLLNCQDINRIHLDFELDIQENIPYLYPEQRRELAPPLNNFLADICRILYVKVSEQIKRPDFQLIVSPEKGVRVIFEDIVDGFTVGTERLL